MEKDGTITRTLTRQILICEEDDEKRKNGYYRLKEGAFRLKDIANFAIGRYAILKGVRLPLSKEARKTCFVNRSGRELGSMESALYNAISTEFMGKEGVNMGMAGAALKFIVMSDIKKYEKGMYRGTGLPVYRKPLPIMMSKTQANDSSYKFGFRDHEKEGKTYNDAFFRFLGITFQIKLSPKDRVGRAIVEKVASGEWNMGESRIYFKGRKLVIDLVYSYVPTPDEGLDPQNWVVAYPAPREVLKFFYVLNQRMPKQPNIYNVGGEGEGDAYRKYQEDWRQYTRRTVAECNMHKGGHGYEAKMALYESVKGKQKNTNKNIIERWANDLITAAIEKKCGTICIFNISELVDAAKRMPILLRDTMYSQLVSKITDKADEHGIKILLCDKENSKATLSPITGWEDVFAHIAEFEAGQLKAAANFKMPKRPRIDVARKKTSVAEAAPVAVTKPRRRKKAEPAGQQLLPF